MKKIYMPDDDLLMEMQAYGGNIYKYLLAKVCESLMVEGTNYPNKGILKMAYKYLRENPDIAAAICLLYTEEIKYSEVASYDASLALKMLTKSDDKTIYKLDNLKYFDEGIGNNLPIIKLVIDILAKNLANCPEYRFDYSEVAGCCHLLDDIFSTKILEKNIFWSHDLKEKITKIEPAYALLIPTVSYKDDFIESTERKKLLRESISSYANRYNLDSVGSRQIDLNNPDENTKKLIRCIKSNPNNLY